jgi:hypothetical protein
MVAYWRLDENAGNMVNDSVGGNDGQIHGADWTPGIINSALSFNSNDNDYVEVPDSTSLSQFNEITVEAWICLYQKTWPEWWGRSVANKYNHAQNQRSYTLGVQNANPEGKNVLVFGLSSTGTNSPSTLFILNGQWDIPLYEWTHVAGTSDGTTMRLYVNGVQEPITRSAPGVIHDSPNPLYIGAYYPPFSDYRTFPGVIDEVAIHSGALSIDEIRQHYENGLNGQGYLAILVEIDIKPGSYPNSINLGSHGLIPVAILSSEDFDATTVDPDTVGLAGAGVEVRGKSNKYMAHQEDVNDDGLIDLVVQVATENLDPGSFQDGYAILSGSTNDGLDFEGLDEITIVPSQ